MPIIANQEPNCRPGDFVSVYPRAVVVCTDLPSTAFPDQADENWVTPNVSVVIGTFLGMKTREEVDALMGRLRERGLKMFVLNQCSMNDILSAKVESEAEKLVRTASAFSTDAEDATSYRIVGMLMADIFKKTGIIRYCWFFDDGRPKTKRAKGDAGSSKGKKETTPAQERDRRWWQFWR